MILVTNDDGIIAPGINSLVKVASKFDEVVVVAPDAPQSGKGHAVTLNQQLRLRKLNMFHGIESYECSGTPVDCVKLATNVVLKDRPISLCLSGINHGANSSINILYSGTMSAAMEASLDGIPSIGFSLLDFSFQADFSAAEVYIEKIIASVINNPMKNCRLLNVNIPAAPLNELKGIKVCRQGEGTWKEEFKEGIDANGEPFYWLTGEFLSLEHPDAQDSDLWALKNNYVSVVPSGHDLTFYKELTDFKHLEDITI